MFDLQEIHEQEETTLTIKLKKADDLVIESKTFASKEWNRAVKKFKPDLRSYIDPDSGMVGVNMHQPKELKQALAMLVTKITQGDQVETDSDKISELFVNPSYRVFPAELQLHLNKMGNEEDEEEQNSKPSSGSSKKAGVTQNKNES